MATLLNGGSTGETKEGYCQPLEKAELVRAGADVTILCYSRMRYVVMQAVAELEKSGYDPEAIALHPPPPPPPFLESLPVSSIVSGLFQTVPITDCAEWPQRKFWSISVKCELYRL